MNRDIQRLTTKQFDVLVIGAGITGACIAHDCALRGLSVALVEKHDFGEAASANSLKVLHGGIRYLQHFDIPRLRESCGERAAFLRIAPQHTRPMPFIVPTYGHGIKGKEAFAAALTLLRLFTFDKRKALGDSPHSIPFGGFHSRSAVRSRFPYVGDKKLTGAGTFYDGQVVNPIRLVLSIVKTAAENGASVANYCDVSGIRIEEDRVRSVEVVDRLTGTPFEVSADMVVNATGPFSSQLAKQLVPGYDGFEMALSRDMAFVLNRQFDEEFAVALQTVHKDHDSMFSRGNRHIFLVPWRHLTLVGVDSKFFEDNPYDLDVGDDEIDLFVREINMSLVDDAITREDVIGVYAGLLPCDGQDSTTGEVLYGKRSLIVDHKNDCGLQNLMSIAAVRLTMGRKIAEKTTDLVAAKLGRNLPACRTASTPVWGGEITDFSHHEAEVEKRLAEAVCAGDAERLVRLYGSRAGDVLELAVDRPLCESLAGTDVARCEVIHAIQAEMAVHLTDFLHRRSELSWTGKMAEQLIDECATLFATELGWDDAVRKREIDDVHELEARGRDFGV